MPLRILVCRYLDDRAEAKEHRAHAAAAAKKKNKNKKTKRTEKPEASMVATNVITTTIENAPSIDGEQEILELIDDSNRMHELWNVIAHNKGGMVTAAVKLTDVQR